MDQSASGPISQQLISVMSSHATSSFLGVVFYFPRSVAVVQSFSRLLAKESLSDATVFYFPKSVVGFLSFSWSFAKESLSDAKIHFKKSVLRPGIFGSELLGIIARAHAPSLPCYLLDCGFFILESGFLDSGCLVPGFLGV